MYSSCKEAHIAVNDKIQQINANRQESIRPQYIDIALNEAIDVLLTQKIKAFEETGRYYDDLQVLKTTYRSPLYLLANEGNRGFAFYLRITYMVSLMMQVLYMISLNVIEQLNLLLLGFTLLISVSYLKLFPII